MIVDNHDGTFFNSTEWQRLSSRSALATSTSLESTAKEPWTDMKTTSASTILLHQSIVHRVLHHTLMMMIAVDWMWRHAKNE